MKKWLLVLCCIAFSSGCKDDGDGKKISISSYSRCKIINSSALYASDRSRDLQKCWDGASYAHQADAMSWCAQKVSAYMASQYVFGHDVVYAVDNGEC